jgi:hypothetical protein
VSSNNPQAKKFDVFLSYKRTDLDLPTVRELIRLLRHYNLVVWFDEDELRPGISWQKLMEVGIKDSRSGIVLIGSAGIGPWQDEEVQALLNFAARLGLPLIPVFLPGVSKQPDDTPLFLLNRLWVDLSAGFTTDGIARLIWGITGEKRMLSPLPHSAYPTNMTQYIAKRGHLIHKLKAKDSTGRWAYYFVLIEGELEQAFMQAIQSTKNIDLEDYGKVVASCYGEEPNAAIKTMLREKYGFII